MRILFDHNAPRPLRVFLEGHAVETTADRGWERLTNGALLAAAEGAGFEILLTADKGFQFQQNLSARGLCVLILTRANWPDVKLCVPKIVEALGRAKAGTCVVVEING